MTAIPDAASSKLRRLAMAILFAACVLPALGAVAGDYHPDAAALAAYDGNYRYADTGSACYVEHYLGEPERDFSIVHEGGTVYMEGPRTVRTPLRAVAPDLLQLPNTEVQYRLVRGADGAITGWVRTDSELSKALEQNAMPGQLCTAASEQRTAVRLAGAPLQYSFPKYERSEVMVMMRDGVKLHVVLLRPAEQGTAGQGSAGHSSAGHGSAPLPVLLNRTPYGVDDWDSDSLNEHYTELARSGYIFAFEDIRGRYGSGGQFVLNRPIEHVMGERLDPTKVDESTDAYDTVSWLVHNVPGNNGRVGVLGVSYGGFTTIMAGIDPHPAVKAISPQAPMTDIWLGDDFFHNGAFRQSYGYDYVMGMESSKVDKFSALKQDAYEYFLHAGNFANAAKSAGIEELPSAKQFLAHPEYSAFWRNLAVEPHLTAAAMPVMVPTLEVGGWWDQEDMWGTQEEYAVMKPHDTQHHVFMVLGPWLHGGWSNSTQSLGLINFGEPTTDEYRQKYEAPFFAYYLKGAAGFDLKDTSSFETGYDRWREYGGWPPRSASSDAKLYLLPDGTIGVNAPPSAKAAGLREFVSDPADPVPYRHRPIQATYSEGSQWYAWMVEDQRFVTARPDVLTWETGPLNHDETMTGNVVADIFAATTGSDADWVVKLIDVYPTTDEGGHAMAGPMAGYQLMINAEIFRGRYLKSFEQPSPLEPGAVNEFRWSLHGADHVFLRGHRIMVEVQSSWFPLYDRNPQTYVPNIMTAPASAYKKETERIYCTPQYPSNIQAPLSEP